MDAFADVHSYVGFALVSVWAVLAGWSLALSFTRYDETPTFWRAVSVAQVLLGIQLLVGLTLWAVRGFSQIGAQGWFSTAFHPLYGFVFPLLVLLVAHGAARAPERDAHRVFALAAFVIFALAARAFMVGAQMG